MSTNENTEDKPLSIEEQAELRRKEIEAKLHPELNNDTAETAEEIIEENITDDKDIIESDITLVIAENNTLPALNEVTENKEIISNPALGITKFADSVQFDKPRLTDSVSLPNVENKSVEPKLITDFDAHLFSNGTYYKVYDKFGAQITIENEHSGVRFSTWAPNANSISVIGEFNGWSEGPNQMVKVHDSGLWSVFIPGLKEGDTYKFAINSNVDGITRHKIDPYAFRSEHRPKNACVVHDINNYTWHDSLWQLKRGSTTYKTQPMNIYELHLGSWKKNYDNTEFPNEWGYMSYSQLAREIVEYVKQMGYTHIR